MDLREEKLKTERGLKVHGKVGMSPIVENMKAGQTVNAFTPKKSASKVEHVSKESNMSEEAEQKTNSAIGVESEQSHAITVEEQKVQITPSTISIAELYAEMEGELVLRGDNKNSGITEKIRETVDAVFAATQKDRLLLAAVTKIVENQTGRKKIYNLVRSVANAKNGKYGLETVNGKAYIILRNA